MARLLKNPDLSNSSATAAKLPIVPSGSQGDAPVTGLIRFNQSNSRIEFYYNNGWNQVAKIGTVQLQIDNFSGDGAQVLFTPMAQEETDPNAIAVFVGGVYQQPSSYTVIPGRTLQFLGGPPPGPTAMYPTQNQIIVIHNLNSTNVAA
jgi:hypothetical protein